MPWSRNDDPDPLEAKRRQLEEQQRLLDEQMLQLKRQLSGDELPEEVKPAEPPVWRMEDDHQPRRRVELASARKRDLARQRQRDMIIFFVCIIALLLAVLIFMWVHSHVTTLNSGA